MTIVLEQIHEGRHQRFREFKADYKWTELSFSKAQFRLPISEFQASPRGILG